jgi:hypothetical protein
MNMVSISRIPIPQRARALSQRQWLLVVLLAMVIGGSMMMHLNYQQHQLNEVTSSASSASSSANNDKDAKDCSCPTETKQVPIIPTGNNNSDGIYPTGVNNYVQTVLADKTRTKVTVPKSISTLITCNTQAAPEALVHYKEMYEVSVLEESVKMKMKEDLGFTFTCGANSNFSVPQLPKGSQINYHQAASIWCALELESKRLGRPANLLVWGLGNDSPFWKSSTKGRVVFMEDNKEWFRMVKKNHPGLEQHLISYSTKISRDLKSFQNNDEKGVLDVVNRSEVHVLDGLKNSDGEVETWDVILVDAPNGCSTDQVGRFTPMIKTKKIISEQKHGLVFVDDYQRRAENVLSDFVLEGKRNAGDHGGGEGYCTKIAVWKRIHPLSRMYIERQAMFAYGESDTDELKTSMQNLDGAQSLFVD